MTLPFGRRLVRGWRAWALGAVLLLGLGAAADRSAAVWLQKSTAEAFQEAQDLPSAPDVSVRGFPVLTQMASGTLDRIDVKADHIPGQGVRPVPVTRLDARLDHVTRSSDSGAAHADSARATAFLSYADLGTALGVDIGPGRDGRVAARATLPLVGEATASARIVVASGNSLAFRDVRVGGDLPDRLKDVVSGALDREIPLDGIPGGLRLTRLTTTSEGLSAELSGKDVTFRPDDRA
ncbi:LmeA family phospholipid-binding protein [Streptomyces sp. DT18]